MFKSVISIAYILLFALFITEKVHAVEVYELQELRLAKAELAMAKGNNAKALELIRENISSKILHLPSITFLSDYYYERRLYSKSMRVLTFAIKKMHNDELLNTPFSNVQKTLNSMKKKPSEEALQFYFQLGKRYYELSEYASFEANFNKYLVRVSFKYFIISKHFGFATSSVNYYLGLLNRKRNKNFGALKNFVDAKNELEKSPDENKDQIENINFLIGDTLVQEGYSGTGSLIFQSLRIDDATNPSLREYADSYIQALSQEYVFVTLSLGSTYSSNINELNRNERREFIDFQSFLIAPELHAREFTLSYASSISPTSKYFNMIFNGSFTQSNAYRKELGFHDFRSATQSVDFVYKNLLKSVVTLNYTLSYSESKSSAEADFKTSSLVHSLTPKLSQATLNGQLNFSTPLTKTYSKFSDTTFDKGASISFTPITFSKRWSPTYTFTYNIEEEPGLENSTSKLLSLANQMRLATRLTLYPSFSFENVSNEDIATAYKETSTSFFLSYSFKTIRSMSWTLSGAYRYKRFDSGSKIKVYTTATNLSYSF